MTDTRSSSSSSGLSPDAADPEFHRRRVAEQIKETVSAPDETDGQEIADEDRHAHRLRELGALSAWVSVAADGDAVEHMIAAQLVTTHDLAMLTLNSAVHGGRKGYFGSGLLDASRIVSTNLRQIETLARYRTWKRRASRDTAIALNSPDIVDVEPSEADDT